MQTQDNWKRRTIFFFVSQSITLFGSQLVQMAIVWYVTLHTGSGAWIAAFSLCSYLPQFFISFAGGVLADRYSKKRLIIAADAIIAAATLAMLLLMPGISSDTALIPALLLMSVIRSAGAGIQSPAVNAVIPLLVPEDSLMRYNGINATMQSTVQFAAPAAAAAVLTMSSLRATLAIDIVTAVIGVGILAAITVPRTVYNAQSEKVSVLGDIATGVKYAYSTLPVRKSLLVYGIFVFLTVPSGYLSGLFVTRMFGDTYWYLTAVEIVGFGGMMLGGILMSAWGGFKSHRFTLALALLLFGAMAAGMAVSRNLIVYLVFMGIYGIAMTAAQTTLTTMLQQDAEPSMQGRVFGLMSSLYSSCYPIGMAVFGPLADSVPLQSIMVLSGVGLVVLAAVSYAGKAEQS